MTSKAKKLYSLYEKGELNNFLPLVIITQEKFLYLSEIEIEQEISSVLSEGTYAVRSSASDEDQKLSQAGKYLSVMNVKKIDLWKAIKDVFESYGNVDLSNEVFIQPYIANSQASGVLFTKDPNTGSDYFVINFELGNNTQQITSGRSSGNTIVIHKSLKDSLFFNNYPWIKSLISLSQFCAEHFCDDSLDIEFAILGNDPIILQVRHLSMGTNKSMEYSKQTVILNEIKNKVMELQERNPFLMGKSTVLGVMPDWNPAELIGIRPNTLALSIFKELITDNIWAYERSNLGYRNVRSFPLLVDLAGHPFIDFRTSVNSLIPKDLDSLLAEKIANLYIERLADNPSLHDKVEFEVVISCFTIDIDEKIDLYREHLSDSEVINLKNSLINLTKCIILNEPYGLASILEKHEPLMERFKKISNSNLNDLNKIYWLIEDCKRYGTLPFAGVARTAFIATSILNSIVQSQILSEEELKNFYAGIRSTASSILPDVKTMSRSDFIDKYGHLRPGTFDITTMNYEQGFELYFPNTSDLHIDSETINISLRKEIIKKIEDSSVLEPLGVTSEQLIGFAETAIAAREEVKFNFSKNISMILELIARIGQNIGFSKEQMSNTHVQMFIRAYRESLSIEQEIVQQINHGNVLSENSSAIWLPPIICSPFDIASFEIPKLLPNFVTKQSISAETLALGSPKESLENRIVLIESADPGFDWIFTRKIAGIITCYGGANSHMAVRTKELNIPAAIGVGEDLFRKLCSSKFVHLDCAKKMIEVMR